MDFSKIIFWCPYCPELRFFETEESVANHFVDVHLQNNPICLRYCKLCGLGDKNILLHFQKKHKNFCLFCTQFIAEPHERCIELVQEAVPRFLLRHLFVQNREEIMDCN